MSFYENFIKKCTEIKKSPSAVAVDCGFSKMTISGWKKGSIPYDASLQRLAEYFGCTPDDLLHGGEEKAVPTREDSPVWQTAMLALKDMSDDELLRVIANAQKIKESRKGSE